MSAITLHIARLSVDSRRKMHGIAYAGGALSYYGEHIAIDLDTLQLNGKQIPLLHNHDRDRHVGYGWLSREGNALAVNGEMLTNEHADAIIAAADEGLEWQMSVHIESDRVITRMAGDIVNGQALEHDDVMLFMNGKIREVSFTPTGVDADTRAQILSLSLQQEPPMNKDQETQLAQLSAENREKDAQLAAKDAQIAALEQQIENDRTSARLTQLKNLGIEGERAAKLAKADADTYAALIEQLQLSAKQQAVLGAHYGADETPTRKNPLLRQ